VRERLELVEKQNSSLSIRRQSQLLSVPRATIYYQPVEENPEDKKVRRALDEIYLKDPCLGSRRLVRLLKRDYKIVINRKRLRRLRQQMGVESIWCRKRKTSLANEAHRKYPYLLRHLDVTEADQVWCADITYIPMPKGHAFLCAVMDWKSRCVLGWAVSNTMDGDLCRQAFESAKANSVQLPLIMNTDQGSQFTSTDWTGPLEELGVKISMDGKGRWMDNVFIERLWRSVKYEDIYIREYGSIDELRRGLSTWFERYNKWRPHETLGNETPHAIYTGEIRKKREDIPVQIAA